VERPVHRVIAGLVFNCLFGTAHAQVDAAAHDRPRNPDAAAIAQLMTAWAEAFNAGDIDRIMAVYGPSIVDMNQDGPTDVGKASLANGYRIMLDSNNGHLAPHIDEIKVFGKFAFLRATFDLTMVPKTGGKTYETRRRLFAIIQKESDGQWRVIRAMNNVGVDK
jgi:uncharacterized protein (TIGR02246 family)